MDRNDRIESFIESLHLPGPVYLEEMAEAAADRGIPVIRPAMRDFLRTVICMNRPMSILEIGTAIGFSALYMKQYAPEGCRIDTIENYEPRITEAKENFDRYDESRSINLIEGDASEMIRDLAGPYDMVFLDGPKGQYINMYDDIKRLIRQGGLLISDNILQEGDVIESRFAVTRRDRTIHARMREYLHTLTNDSDYSTSVLNVADGATMSVRL